MDNNGCAAPDPHPDPSRAATGELVGGPGAAAEAAGGGQRAARATADSVSTVSEGGEARGEAADAGGGVPPAASTSVEARRSGYWLVTW